MKSFLLSVAFGLGGILLLGIALRYIGFQEVLTVFSDFPWWSIAPVIILTGLGWVTGAWRWRRILQTLEADAPFRPLAGIHLASLAFSYITPVVYIGGEIVRVVLSKDRLSIPAKKSFGSTVIDKVLDGTVWAIMIMAGIVLFIMTVGTPDLTRAVVLAISGLIFFAVIIFFTYFLSFQRARVVHHILKLFKWENSHGGIFLQEVEALVMDFFQFNNRVFWEALFLSFIKITFFWLRNIFVIALLGKGVQVVGGLILFVFFAVGYSFPIPGAIGFQEVSQIFAFSWLGFGAHTGAAFSLLVRGADIFFILAGCIFLLRWGTGLFVFHLVRKISGGKHE